MSKLVVVESPSKVKSIKKYLGGDYEVVASMGHVIDLPKSDLGVDIEKNFEPAYVVTKQKALTKLKQAFKGKQTLVLAVDPDREGEAIGWHVAQKLGVIDKKGKEKSNKKLERIVFTEITESAVKEAVKHPRGVDMNLVDAQQTRRILDRLVGYKLSPLLWKKIMFGLSAGRVQSVAVKLIVDRERERRDFKPEEYWNMSAFLSRTQGKECKIYVIKSDEASEVPKQQEERVKFDLVKKNGKKITVKDEKTSKEVLEDIKNAEWKISKIEEKDLQRYPSPPFKTSTLQQEASNKLGFSAKRTMMAAQRLYEAGFITYMRTDSISMSMQAINSAREYINKNYGREFVSEKAQVYKTKSKVAQEAHEAIRPTNFNLHSDKIDLSDDAKKLYSLIWKKALASQAAPASVKQRKVEVDVREYTFEAVGNEVIFEGYYAITGFKEEGVQMEVFKEAERVYPLQINALQNFTMPPARYSEATLIKVLEKEGIGRPSTYASIISTILSRKYVIKEGKYFIPTDTGFAVTKLLEQNFKDVVDLKFTANMEDDLDKVADGKREWQKVVKEFYGPFESQLKSKEKEIEREDYTVLENAPEDIKCPICSSPMVVKLGRYGRFYSCSRWPECKGLLNQNGETQEALEKKAKSKDFLSKYKPSPKTEDGRDYLLKEGRYGKFWAHPDYPKVKDAQPLEYTDEIFKKIYGSAPKTKDGKKMVLRRGKFGEFWAHPKYPEVKEVERIDKKEVALRKKELGLE